MVFGLVGALISNRRPASALRAAERCLARWPRDPDSASLREEADKLRAGLAKAAAEKAQPFERFFEASCLEDDFGRYIGRGEPEAACKAMERLLAMHPGYVPALNNLALAAWEQGDAEGAMKRAREVLELEADNVHALSNLVRFSFLLGRFEEAQAYGERLRRSAAPAFDG